MILQSLLMAASVITVMVGGFCLGWGFVTCMQRFVDWAITKPLWVNLSLAITTTFLTTWICIYIIMKVQLA